MKTKNGKQGMAKVVRLKNMIIDDVKHIAKEAKTISPAKLKEILLKGLPRPEAKVLHMYVNGRSLA